MLCFELCPSRIESIHRRLGIFRFGKRRLQANRVHRHSRIFEHRLLLLQRILGSRDSVFYVSPLSGFKIRKFLF